MNQLTDTILKMQSGSKKAFKEIFDEFYTPLCSFAYRYLEDTAGSADVVQEVFLALWNNHANFSNEGTLRSYLFTSVRNSCLNIIRHEKVKERNRGELAEFQQTDTTDEHEIEAMVYAEVHKAIQHLSPQAREVVIHSMNGLTNNEVADELNVSVNTVKTLKKRAYKTLREKLGGMHWVLIVLV
ncbi:RNA polymerase sigma-70 factor [Carboxylicivirga sp. RSCT41]|uniref:RNA polymerase sigma-70 factor n=1 Tax=Carboxylicivirga agarovorans TaxID=3417570 RepID=UPI003D33121E